MSTSLDAEGDGGVQLVRSVVESPGHALLAEALDLGLDEFLSEGLLKDIPVIGWLVKVAGGVLTVRDRLFARKLVAFLTNVAASPARVAAFVEELEVDPLVSRRAGETLLLLIERHEHIEKSAIVGRLLSARLDGRIDGPRFIELATALDRASLDELLKLRRLVAGEAVESLDVLWALSRSGVATVQFNLFDSHVAMGHSVNALGTDLVELGVQHWGDQDPANVNAVTFP